MKRSIRPTTHRIALALCAALTVGALAAPDAPAEGDRKKKKRGDEIAALTTASIDTMMAAKWADEGLTPSARSSDLAATC